MHKHQLYINLLVTASALALTACADEVANVVTPDSPTPDAAKTPIELSLGGVDSPASTRAVITDGKNPDDTDKTMKPFDVNTKIFMIMKSEYYPFSSPYLDFNYGGSWKVKYTVTRGDVAASSSDVVFNDASGNRMRYWDDAHARSSQITIWAYAQKGESKWNNCTFEIPNNGGTGLNEYKDQEYYPNQDYQPWSEAIVYPAIRYWRSSHHQSDDIQDEQSVRCQDLLFSNNIADYSSQSGSDWRLKFDPANKRFPYKTDEWTPGVKKTEMKFYHAMSKITIHIKKGSGFETGDFAFTGTGNVKLKGFNKKGLFHIGDGQFEYIWPHIPGSNDQDDTDENAFCIPQIYKWSSPATNDDITLEALIVPNVHGNVAGLVDTHSRFVKDAKTLPTDVMMEFTINNNKYQITSGQLYTSLVNSSDEAVDHATKKTDNGITYIPLEAGKNYHFTFTIGKSKVDNITAQVADWETVNAEPQSPSNARIKLQLEERGNNISQESKFDFYRSLVNYTATEFNDNFVDYNWKTGYTNTNSKTVPTYNNNTWHTNWFWENNKQFYHFRALGIADNSNPIKLSSPSSSPAVTQDNNGDYISISSGSTYTDLCWGAPMLDDGDNETPGAFWWNYGPNTNGFDAKDDGTVATGLPTGTQHQIYKAIGATENPIKLILFHMMSDLTFNIKTTTGTDAVNLGDGSSNKTKVELVDYKTGGKVLMGNGLVTATEPVTTAVIEQNTFTSAAGDESAIVKYVYGAVPQSLENVKLRITTPDNNQYIVDMKDVKAKATNISSSNIANPYSQVRGEGADADKYKINRWYPGFKYTYTFTLKKTGIADITATVVNWETIEADNEDVTIK